MSAQLMKYLLADAKEVKDAGPSPYEGDSSNLRLALRRHGPVQYARERQRHTYDFDKIRESPEWELKKEGGRPPDSAVQYRRTASSNLANSGSRHSLNLEMLLSMNGRKSPSSTTKSSRRRRTVHFDDAPEVSVDLSKYKEEEERESGENTSGTDAQKYRRRRKSENEDLKKADLTGISPQLCKLLDIKPRNYTEAQRLKKMLKRAVSGPNATFEDLKAYRIAMKKLRRIVREEQEREIVKTEEEMREKEFQDFMHKVIKNIY